MRDSGLRWLMLSAAGAALVLLPDSSVCRADETLQSSAGNRADWTIQIVAERTERTERSEQPEDSFGIVISPLVQSKDEQESPILVPPSGNEPKEPETPEELKATKKPVKPGAKKRSSKAPVATETVSEKAREEWQKKRAAQDQKRKTKSDASVKSEDTTPNRKPVDKDSKATLSRKQKLQKAKAATDKAKAVAEGSSTAAPSKAATIKKTSKPAAPKASLAAPVTVRRDSRTYQEIYRSIPFSRAEYDANPAYRHLATMEIMLGQLHPVIVAPPAPPQPKYDLTRPIPIRLVPLYWSRHRPGYRPYTRYPWH